MKVSDDLTLRISLPWLIQLVVVVGAAVTLFFTLKMEINEAADSPVSIGEYTMKFEFMADEIMELEERVKALEEKE